MFTGSSRDSRTTSAVGTPFGVVATYGADSNYQGSHASVTQMVVPDVG